MKFQPDTPEWVRCDRAGCHHHVHSEDPYGLCEGHLEEARKEEERDEGEEPIKEIIPRPTDTLQVLTIGHIAGTSSALGLSKETDWHMPKLKTYRQVRRLLPVTHNFHFTRGYAP